MARSRVHPRLIPAAALLLVGLPLSAGVSRPTATAAATRQAVLDVPKAMLRSPSVPVIVEMDSPTSRDDLLSGQPQVQGLVQALRARLLDVLHADGARNIYPFHVIPAIAASVPGQDLQTLLRQPGVRAVVLDRQHPLLPLPDQDTLRSAGGTPPGTPGKKGTGSPGTVDEPVTVEPESFGLTRADVAQAHGYTGAGVRVAVIDSGIDPTEPDLSGVLATDAQGHPLRVDFTNTGLQDTVGHGTACASMIVSQGRTLYSGNNLLERGAPLQVYPQPAGKPTVYQSHFHVYGMAPGVRIMSAKIFDTRAPHGGGYDSTIVRAVEWAIDNHAGVISESFGGLSIPGNGTDPTAVADEAAVRAGITVVVAAGNSGPGATTIQSPAIAPGVIAVGASTDWRNFGQTGFLATFGHTTADNIASFTSRGPTVDGRPIPDLVAPGAYGWALFPETKSDDGPTHPPYDVGSFGGTSQATPVTAGAAALVISAYQQTHNGARPAPALVRSILMSSARDLGYPATDQGAGRLDAWEAVQTALHSGSSFLLGPNSLAVAGAAGAPFQTTFAITNTGVATQRYNIDATISHESGRQEWTGTVQDPTLRPYHFTVAPGVARIVGAVNWNAADRFTVGRTIKEVAMRVALYDPLGRFVNYSFGLATGYAETQAAHPMAGTWTMVISENGRKDSAGIRRYTHETYTARLTTFSAVPYGSLSPGALTLAPGQAARVTLSGTTPAKPGMQGVTVHVAGDHTAAVPVVVTSYMTLYGNDAGFQGVFTGVSNAYFSLANDNKSYALNVPPGTRTLNVALSWPDPGYGVFLLLIDPSGEVVDQQSNFPSSANDNGTYDFAVHNLVGLWSNPTPGRWQIVVMNAVFAGKQSAEPFSGHVTLNAAPVTPDALSYTVVPGASFNLDLHVQNANSLNVAEGYVGYATTDQYSYLPLGEIHAPFGPAGGGVTGTTIYTFTTGFVPPGTQMIVTSFAAVNPAVPIDLNFSDPSFFSYTQGRPGPVTIDGQTYQNGVTAVITGKQLPIGSCFGEITLRGPRDTPLVHGNIVGASYAYALTPLPWVSFDHGLLPNGHVTGGDPLILLPHQKDALHASVTVPLSTAPGTYHARLFVYSVYLDQVAVVPLTITVQPHTGVEPGSVGR